jgi:secreted Zn-dependent insulinase-like peptidase
MGKGGAAQDIIKPLTFDKIGLRHIALSNGLEFILVSDAELDKAGASVDVRPASFLSSVSKGSEQSH